MAIVVDNTNYSGEGKLTIANGSINSLNSRIGEGSEGFGEEFVVMDTRAEAKFKARAAKPKPETDEE